ncbi:MAG TPA: hypothetical protein VJI69_00455 [Bacteroidia bacterium]|nr:hypothetical protein [Bacteroidia bacterium]
MNELKKIFLLFLLTFISFQNAGHAATITADSLTKTKRYSSMLVANGQWAIKTMGVGVKYSGALQLKKYPRIGIGPSIFLEHVEFQKGVKFPTNVTEASISFTTPGLNLQIRCSKILSAQIGLSLLIGSEQITKVYYENTNPNPFGTPTLELRQKTENNTISGVQLEQNLFYLPQEKTGLTFGIGIFERSLSATFYDSDFGGKVYLGFYF